MAYSLADLQTLRDTAMTRLQEALASPKPTYTVDGQTFKWQEYTEMLMSTIKNLNELIVREDTTASGTVQEETVVEF